MDKQYWSDWLESSLDDGRLDDNERRDLKSRLTDGGLREDEYSYLRNQSFKIIQKKLAQGEDAAALFRWLERTLKVMDGSRQVDKGAIAASWFSPGRDCAGGIIEQLRLARKTIDICVFTIADDELTKHILEAHKRGVAVRVITDNDKMYDMGSDIEYLAKQGVSVKIDTTSYHMHHKFAIFDQKHLINGSFNWTRSASKYNQEDITLTDDPRFVTEFSKQFDKLWQRFPCHKPSQR